jgi:hypothetical protein
MEEISTEYFGLLRYDMSLGEWFLTFQKNIVLSSSEMRVQEETSWTSVNCRTLEHEDSIFHWNFMIHPPMTTGLHPKSLSSSGFFKIYHCLVIIHTNVVHKLY